MQEMFLVCRITQCDFMLLHKLLCDTDQAQATAHPVKLPGYTTRYSHNPICLKWHNYIFPLLHGFEMTLLKNIRKSVFVVVRCSGMWKAPHLVCHLCVIVVIPIICF